MINIDNYFPGLEFDEKSHTYKRDGLGLPSVSFCIKKFHKEFDPDIVKYSAKKQGKTTEDLQAEWTKITKDACDKGHTIHEYAELYHTNCLKPSSIEELAVVQFYMDLPSHIIPMFMECRIYYGNHYAGTFDKLLYDTSDDSWILSDWKTNKDLHKNYKGQMLYEPFDDLLETPLHKYYIQLNHYALPLIEAGINIKEMWVIHLKPNVAEYPKLYTKYTIPNLTDKLKKYYDDRDYHINSSSDYWPV